ncbi:hypothetical protein BBF96_14900 [Anoxybacter fermentans]|uniref:DUF4178 domain-containing protein n=1 Tax=Anoxybacter fermentans TaxID=1323375 RepID=A0A3Q9HS62_9FIRM|nr:DUF4178 domain-containing protein [Anoxybacter fermentans]AZR74562.1 hypothetical protein BBF96_14900 [Anoxybacter fermentans]
MSFFKRLFGGGKKKSKIQKRNPFNLQVGDVVSYDLEDYIVIGKLVYNDSSYEWYAYQLDSGSKRIWLASEDDDEIILGIYESTDLRLTNVPNEIEYKGQIFYLEEHGKATITTADGRVGAKTGQVMEYWDFESDNGDFLSVEKWGNEIEVSYGYPIDEHELEFLPGSQE